MLKFAANMNQWAAMEGLAYWIADNAYCRERMNKEDYEREEHARHHETIISLFNELDALNVPYWVQNAVIAWAEDWRRQASEYMETALNRGGYSVSRA